MGKLKQFLSKKEKKEVKAAKNALGFKKQRWDWDFKIWSPVEYELNMVFCADDKLFLSIFKKAMARMERKGVINDGNPENIDRFDLDERFYNLVKTYLKKPFNITAKDVLKEHGFQFLDYHVVKGVFEREASRNWLIRLTLKGTYTVNR